MHPYSFTHSKSGLFYLTSSQTSSQNICNCPHLLALLWNHEFAIILHFLCIKYTRHVFVAMLMALHFFLSSFLYCFVFISWARTAMCLGIWAVPVMVEVTLALMFLSSSCRLVRPVWPESFLGTGNSLWHPGTAFSPLTQHTTTLSVRMWINQHSA